MTCCATTCQIQNRGMKQNKSFNWICLLDILFYFKTAILSKNIHFMEEISVYIDVKLQNQVI